MTRLVNCVPSTRMSDAPPPPPPPVAPFVTPAAVTPAVEAPTKLLGGGRMAGASAAVTALAADDHVDHLARNHPDLGDGAAPLAERDDRDPENVVGVTLGAAHVEVRQVHASGNRPILRRTRVVEYVTDLCPQGRRRRRTIMARQPPRRLLGWLSSLIVRPVMAVVVVASLATVGMGLGVLTSAAPASAANSNCGNIYDPSDAPSSVLQGYFTPGSCDAKPAETRRGGLHAAGQLRQWLPATDRSKHRARW